MTAVCEQCHFVMNDRRRTEKKDKETSVIRYHVSFVSNKPNYKTHTHTHTHTHINTVTRTNKHHYRTSGNKLLTSNCCDISFKRVLLQKSVTIMIYFQNLVSARHKLEQGQKPLQSYHTLLGRLNASTYGSVGEPSSLRSKRFIFIYHISFSHNTSCLITLFAL